MQANQYDDNGITNYIQEKLMTRFSIWSTTNQHIVWSKPTHCNKYRYNIHKHINENDNVSILQWNNNPYTGYIEKKTQNEVQPMIRLYNMHKHINVDPII